MKCSECGADLVDGAKFCGECGAKVKVPIVCPECSKELSEGTKFCPECGCRIAGEKVVSGKVTEGEAKPRNDKEDGEDENGIGKLGLPSRWDGTLTVEDLSTVLDDDEAKGIDAALCELKSMANDGRILVRSVDRKSLAQKIEAFSAGLAKRLGESILAKQVTDTALGFIDYGANCRGTRGVLFTRFGVFYMSSEYPKIVDGDVAGGVIPWALLYKFGKSSGMCWKVDLADVLSSEEVDEEVKEGLRSPDPELVLKAYFDSNDGTVGLDKGDVSDFFDSVKKALDGEAGEMGLIEGEDEVEEEEE